MTTREWMNCLAKTESGDDPNAPLGDHGRAFGRWQVYPDWLWGWTNHYGTAPRLGETWDEFRRSNSREVSRTTTLDGWARCERRCIFTSAILAAM